jgi:hypothetical protein
MKIILSLTLTAILICNAYGQSDKYLTFELAGSGGLASVNYETSLLQKESINLYLRFGFSVAPIDKNNGVALVFPVMAHAVWGKTKHKLDIGLGQSISITTTGQYYILMPLSVGYRFQPEDKNYYLRAAYTPIVSYLLDFQWQHWAGITFGYKLNRK